MRRPAEDDWLVPGTCTTPVPNLSLGGLTMSKKLITKLRQERDAARASADTILSKAETGAELTDLEKTNLAELEGDATQLDARILELTNMELARIEAAKLDRKLDTAMAETVIEVNEPARDIATRFTESDAFSRYQQTPAGTSAMFEVEDFALSSYAAGDPLKSVDANGKPFAGVTRASDRDTPNLGTPLLDAMFYEPVTTNAIEWIHWPAAPLAEVVAEGAVKPEHQLAPTLVEGTLEKLAHHTPVTREMLEDVPRTRAIIEGKLLTGVRLKAEANGIAALAAAALPPTVAAAGKFLEAIRVGIATVQEKGFNPNVVALNPFDYADIDIALLGKTLNGAITGTTPWGLSFVPSFGIKKGEAYVGDFKQGMTLFDRRTLGVYITDSHGEEFTKNILRILAEGRMKAVVTDANAITKVAPAGAPAAAPPAAK
jgi:Phage capsid family